MAVCIVQAVQACGCANLGRNVPASAHRMSKVDFRLVPVTPLFKHICLISET